MSATDLVPHGLETSKPAFFGGVMFRRHADVLVLLAPRVVARAERSQLTVPR